MYVYLITNKKNGKRYVGQTTVSLSSRFARHCWASEHTKNMPIGAAIRKYGKDSFEIEELCQCSSQEELDAMEIFHAKRLNTFVPHGYNLKAGAGPGAMSDATKKKIGDAHRGKKASAEARKRMSDAHMGRRWSTETRAKVSARMRGVPPHPAVRLGASLKSQKTYLLIDPLGNEITVVNMRRHCREFGLSVTKMASVSTGKTKQHKGWRLA